MIIMRGIAFIKYFCLFLLTLNFFVLYPHSGMSLIQVPGISDVHSIISNGRYSIEKLAQMAKERGIEILIVTDHDLVAMSYGIPPFRHLFRYRKERSSIFRYGVERYLQEIEYVNRKYSDVLVIPGIKSAPFYYWTGSYFNKDLTAHNYNKQFIILGLEDPLSIKRLPIINNPHLSLRFTRELLPQIFLFILVIICSLILLFWPGVFRFTGIFLIILSLLFIINDHPFKCIRFDPYKGDPGIGPYQDLIDYVDEKGGMTFWVMPDSKSFQRIPPIFLKTESHAQDLILSRRYTGFEVLYGDVLKAQEPGGIWDTVLKSYCRGERSKPCWGISGSDYYYEGKSEMKMSYFQTIFLLHEKSKRAVLSALNSGKMYALRNIKGSKLKLEDFYIKGSDSSKAYAGDTALAKGGITFFCCVDTWDGEKRPVRVKVIRFGEVIKDIKGNTPLKIMFKDEKKDEKKIYYRLDIKDGYGNYIISNPIFVKFT